MMVEQKKKQLGKWGVMYGGLEGPVPRQRACRGSLHCRGGDSRVACALFQVVGRAVISRPITI